MPLNNTALDAAALQALFERLGIVTGAAVSQKVSEALSLTGTDVTELQARMNTIESILDADPNTPEFDVAQNIVTQLTTLTTRLDNAEDPAVAGSLANQIADLTTQLASLANDVAELQTAVDSMNGAFSDMDALVASFCTGVNSGLTGTTDPSCTIGSNGTGL